MTSVASSGATSVKFPFVSVEVPVLHIAGEGDPIIRPEMLDEAARYCAAGYQLHVVRGVGHYPAEEDPDRVTDLIADLVRDL